MSVIFDNFEQLWHEELVTISLLKQGNHEKGELKRRIREIQKQRLSSFSPHSDSAYDYWLRALKNRRIIIEESKMLNLTNLGRWIANGNAGSLQVRNQFAYLICDKCSSHAQVVLRTPLTNTLRVNSKGNPFMDVRCPECGSVSSQHNLGSIANKEQFIDFYNQALAELGKFIKVVGIPIWG